MADDFYSFDEALDELKLKEEELKRLVSEGELRAFRKGDTMKIRRADVELLRAELDADVADLDDTVDELVFEDDSDLDADAGMATQELDVETLVDEEEPVAAEPARASRSSASARPAKRSAVAVAAAAAEEEEEPAWVKGLLMVSALLLMLAMPIMLSLGTGNAGGLAKGVAGLFGAEFDQAAASQPAEAPADE